jgi:hypothetical protein
MAEANATVGRIAWLAVTIVPPSAAIGTWPGWVRDHPVLSVALFVGYECLVAVMVFFRDIARELAKRWRGRIVDHLDQALGRRFLRFDRRYREFTLAALRFVDQKGLATIGPYTPELDEVFVDVSLAPRSPHQVDTDPLAELPPEITERSALWDFLDRVPAGVLAVVGPAGSGKTTLLRHTARRICRTGGRRRRTVPVFLFLRDHAAAIVDDPDSTLPDLLRGTLGRFRADEPPGWFEQKLRDGAATVLLDGLDEVAHRPDRRAVADWVERQIEQYPRNDYVITSRPHGYRAAEIAGATVLQVRRFTDEQVTRFVHGWYRWVERQRSGEDAQQAEQRAESAAEELLDRLRTASALYELTVNPLLLTMIANVHHYRSALPGSRAELYGEICEVMLWRRQSAKKLPVELGGDQKELLLRRLAFTMMERRVRDLPSEEVVAALEPALRRVSKRLTADAFLTDAGSNGLLVERENGLYSFAHHTFQEYLAAAHIQDKNLSGTLTAAVEDTWWRESTLLYAARGDADPLIRACLRTDTVTALALAFDCARYAREIDPDLRARLDRLLESCYEPGTDPGRRRMMAHVMVTRELRHPVAAEGGRLCAQPISAAVYWLFLRETGHPAPDDPRPFKPGSDGPVLGVRGGDLPAFVQWVNGIVGGEPVYRLPARAEIEAPVLRRALAQAEHGPLSVWFENGRVRELRTPENHPHPHEISALVLARHVTDDLRTAAPTCARLLLIRSLVVLRAVSFDLVHSTASSRARTLASELVHALARAADLALSRVQDLDLARALDPAVAHAFDLARAIDREADHARALELARLRDLARIRAVDLALALDLALARAFNVARAREREQEPERDRDLVHELDRALDRDIEYARDLASMLNTDLNRALDANLELELDTVLALDLALDAERTPVSGRELDRHLAVSMGRALSGSLSVALREADPMEAGDWHRFQSALAEAFVAETGISGGDQIVPPDSLADEVRDACAALSGKDGSGSCPAWVRAVAGRLARLAVPLCTRVTTMTPGRASAVRVAALCLACEAEARHQTETAAAFRRIAAGITLLERRSTGVSRPTEVVVLATA